MLFFLVCLRALLHGSAAEAALGGARAATHPRHPHSQGSPSLPRILLGRPTASLQHGACHAWSPQEHQPVPWLELICKRCRCGRGVAGAGLVEVGAVPVGRMGLAWLLARWGPPAAVATLGAAEPVLAAGGQAVQRALLAAAGLCLATAAAAGAGAGAACQAARAGLGGAGVHAGGHGQHHGADNDDDVDELLALLQLADVAARDEDDTLAFAGRLVAHGHADLVLGGRQQVSHRVGVDAGADVDGILLGGVVAAHQEGVPGFTWLRCCRCRCEPLQGDAVDGLLGDAHLHVGARLSRGHGGPVRGGGGCPWGPHLKGDGH